MQLPGLAASTPVLARSAITRAARRPVRFAAIVTVVFAVGLLPWVLAMPHPVRDETDTPALLLGLDATRVLVPAAFLAALGWWNRAGLTTRLTWHRIIPFLPLVIYPVLPLVFGSGITVTDPWKIVLLVVTYAALGFGEETTFRGVVLQTLKPRGVARAAVVSSICFGLMHIVNIATGANVVNVAFTVGYTALLGFAYAATVLVTRTIWPAVLIHGATDFVNAIQFVPATPGTSEGPDVASGLMNLAIAAIFAAYGLWLLRHHLASHPGERDEMRLDRLGKYEDRAPALSGAARGGGAK